MFPLLAWLTGLSFSFSLSPPPPTSSTSTIPPDGSRPSRRYAYENLVTGETQSEPPEEDGFGDDDYEAEGDYGEAATAAAATAATAAAAAAAATATATATATAAASSGVDGSKTEEGEQHGKGDDAGSCETNKGW